MARVIKKRECKFCGETDKSKLVKNKHQPEGLARVCKKCNYAEYQKSKRDVEAGKLRGRKSLLNKKFGISLDEYDVMLKNQDYRCAVCGRHQSVFNRNLAVDHNHDTGEIRGLLCRACNTALGLLREDKDTILNLLEYVRKCPQNREKQE